MPKVGIVMGSKNDLEQVLPAINVIKEFGIEVEARVISAHRTPDDAHKFSADAMQNGIEVIICAAGKAAHLGGVMASFSPLPIIGLPIKSSTLDGLDSLLSTVQMPPGIPVATVAINGGLNAGLLAIQILGIKYPKIMEKFIQYKANLAKKVQEDDKKLQQELQ